MDKTIIEFCSGCSKCPVLEVSEDRIVLSDHDQDEPGRVTLSRQQAQDLLEGLRRALAL
ncbi:MAG: hypothetical protein AB1634_17495 [Thermodesulfobacteriota bacterium]